MALDHPPGVIGRRLLAGLADLLLPATCPLCPAPGPDCCAACLARLPELPDPCPLCAAPGAGLVCRRCQGRGLPWLHLVHVRWVYSDGIRDLVHRAKAGGDPTAVRACCRLLIQPAQAPAWVVPIPPAPGRRSGPHLATALARTVTARGGRLCRDLRLTRLPAAQHRLGIGDRRRNVTDLFTCTTALPARILLVDDLLTTGATASAAARCLRAAGAKRVDLLVLARTPDGTTQPARSVRGDLHTGQTADATRLAPPDPRSKMEP